MKKIILVGCRGSGKSTLARACSEKYKFKLIDYGNPIRVTRDERILENYIETRKEYIEGTINFLKEVKYDHVIQARGPETLYTYSIFYPIIVGKKWDINLIMNKEMDHLREYFADYVIMLDLSPEEVEERYSRDRKKRTNINFWKILWFNYEKPFFEKFDNLLKINSFHMSIDECVTTIAEFIKEKEVC